MIRWCVSSSTYTLCNAVVLQWGFNVVRLGFHWHMVEPTPGQYDMNYVNEIVSFVDRLNRSGIHAIMDMHQDCWSPLFCDAHGIPAAYAQGYDANYNPHGKKAYPLPIVTPTYNNNNEITDCSKVNVAILGGGSCYPTYAVGAAAQRLYDNDKGILDRFGDMWKLIAGKVKDFPNVLGYELINEPWIGDVPLSFEEFIPTNPHWNLWFPGEADKKNLQGFYTKLHENIRTVDNDSIIFFEPSTGGNFLDAFPVGFTQGPGGPEYNDRQALSYHVYCPFVDSKNTSSFLQYIIKEISKEGCDLLNDPMYDVRNSDAKKLGLAGFMTEFGNNGLGVTPDLLHFATKKMDEFMHGWTYWYLTPDPKVTNSTVISNLARPFPHKIAGTPTSYSFDPEHKVFQLEYMPCTDDPCASKPTEIFTSQKYSFSYGMKVSIDSENEVTHSVDEDSQMLYVSVTKVVAGKPVMVKITVN